MKYPPLSELEPEQLQAIDEAKSKGSSLFRREWITYIIGEKLGHSVVMARDAEGNDAGYIATSPHWQHYAIEVPPQFRGMWIGKILMVTKQSMDGILAFDWTDLYSHIFFLIKRGYVPVSKMMDYYNSKKLDIQELNLLIRKLQYFYSTGFQHGFTEDISPLVVQLQYSPRKAKKFLQENNLE